jgi:hypothetical protein
MNIAFHIPTWLFWALGVPLAVVVLFFACIGWRVLRDWTSPGGNV